TDGIRGINTTKLIDGIMKDNDIPLHQKLIDLLVKYYVCDNPENQAVWSHEKIYGIRTNKMNEDTWHIDIEGLLLREMLIRTYVNYLEYAIYKEQKKLEKSAQELKNYSNERLELSE